MIVFAVYTVLLPGTVNTAETPSRRGAKNKIVLEIMVNHLVTPIALLMELKLPPRAARGILGSLDEQQRKHQQRRSSERKDESKEGSYKSIQ